MEATRELVGDVLSALRERPSEICVAAVDANHFVRFQLYAHGLPFNILRR